MRTLPPELLIVAFLLALAIIQILRNTRRKPPTPAPPPARREAGIEKPQRRARLDMPDEVLASSAPSVPADGFGRSAAAFAVEARPAGRYARTSLLGNRRQLRKAIVVAAILGPCRAVEPHDLRH